MRTKKHLLKLVFITSLVVIPLLLPYLVVRIFSIDLGNVVTLLRNANKKVVIEAIIIDLIFIFSYSLSLHSVFKTIIKNIKVTDSIKASLLSWFFFNTTPFGAITGDAAKIVYIARKYKKKASHLVVAATLQRIVSTTVFVIIFLTSLIYSYIHFKIKYSGFFGLFAIVILLTFISIIIFTNKKILEKILKKAKIVKQKQIKEILEATEKAKKNKKHVISAIIFSTIHWISGIFIPFVFIRYFDLDINIFLLASAYIFYSFIDNIPAILPSNLGINESAMTTSFILIGLSKNVAAAVTLLTRAVTVIFETVFSGIVSYFIGINTIKSYLKKGVKKHIF